MYEQEKVKQSEVVSSQVTGNIVIDLLQQASILQIDPKVIDHSAFAPGLYIQGRAKSLVNFSEPVFTMDDFQNKDLIFAKDHTNNKFLDTVVSLDNFRSEASGMKPTITPEQIVGGKYVTLYNQYGRVIRTGYQLAVAGKLLSAKPSLLQMKCSIVNSVFASIMTRRRDLQVRGHWNTPKVEHFVLEDYHKELIDEQELEFQLEPEIVRLEHFINEAPFHIYFTKVTARCMVVYRTCDWRVYEYYRMIEEKLEQTQKV